LASAVFIRLLFPAYAAVGLQQTIVEKPCRAVEMCYRKREHVLRIKDTREAEKQRGASPCTKAEI